MGVQKADLTPMKLAALVLYNRYGLSQNELQALNLSGIKDCGDHLEITATGRTVMTNNEIDNDVIRAYISKPGHRYPNFLSTPFRTLTGGNVHWWNGQFLGTKKRTTMPDAITEELHHKVNGYSEVKRYNLKDEDTDTLLDELTEDATEPEAPTSEPAVAKERLPLQDVIAIAEVLVTKTPSERERLISMATRGKGTTVLDLLNALEDEDIKVRTVAMVSLVLSVEGGAVTNLPYALQFIKGWDDLQRQQEMVEGLGLNTIAEQLDRYLDARYNNAQNFIDRYNRVLRLFSQARSRYNKARADVRDVNKLLVEADKEVKLYKEANARLVAENEQLTQNNHELTRENETVITAAENLTSEAEPVETPDINEIFHGQRIAIVGAEQREHEYRPLLEKLGAQPVFPNTRIASETADEVRKAAGALLMIRLLGHIPYQRSLDVLRRNNIPYEVVHTLGGGAVTAAALRLATTMETKKEQGSVG